MIDKFSILKEYKTWMLQYSGGIDSTLLLYYLNKIRTNQEWWIGTGVNNNETIYNRHALDIIDVLGIDNVYHVLYPQTHITGEEKHKMDKAFHMRMLPHLDPETSIVIQGRNKNPDHHIAGEDIIRNGGSPELSTELGFTVFRPWANMNKKEIVECYRKEGIINLINYTRSCVSLTEDECGKCFWCKEKAWGMEV